MADGTSAGASQMRRYTDTPLQMTEGIVAAHGDAFQSNDGREVPPVFMSTCMKYGTAHVAAEYHPEKREIIMHLPNGHTGLIKTNPENYATVEQLVRRLMRQGRFVEHGL